VDFNESGLMQPSVRGNCGAVQSPSSFNERARRIWERRAVFTLTVMEERSPDMKKEGTGSV
jgi:hypothetical protein